MKSGLAWILVLSLAANGALLAARWRASSTAASAPSDHVVALGAGGPAGIEAVSVGPAGASPPVEPARGPLGSTFDAGDLRAVAAALRAAGLPEPDVREIVRAMIGDRFKARYEAATAARYQQPFWKTRNQFAELSQRISESSAIAREEEALRTEILGPEPLDPIEAWYLRRNYGGLPDRKLSALSRLERDYSELTMQARSSGFGPQMPWEGEHVGYIEAEKRRDLEALLSPEELRLYNLQTSGTAHTLRGDLTGFAATESEFLDLYALYRARDEKYNLYGPGWNSSGWAAAEKAKPELIKQVQATLGEERFKDYERATDAGYKAAFAVERRLNLPADSASRAFDLTGETRAAVKALNRDTSLTPAERSAAMNRLVTEANTRLDGLLTKTGASVYRSRSDLWRYVESERAQKEKEAR